MIDFLVLFAVVFAEAIFLPVVPDLLVGGLAASTGSFVVPFFVATVASVAGASVGYLLGKYFARVGERFLERTLGKVWSKAKELGRRYGEVAVVVGALTPVPYKVVAIMSGFLGFGFFSFLALSFLCRGLRFAAVGWLSVRLGEEWLKGGSGALWYWALAACAVLLIYEGVKWTWRRLSSSLNQTA